MKIKIGEFDVLDSGTVIGNDNEPTDFIMNEAVDFVVRFVFVTDASTKEWSVKADKHGKRGVKLTFTNYNNSLGIGNILPIKIGKFTKRELFINYRIYSLTSGGKLIHYTWLLGKEVADGK